MPAAAGGQASTAGYYSTSTAFLEALAEAGVSYVFANLGTDHPGLIEAYAQAKAQGLQDAYPRLIICPHEMVALSAAHAYAMIAREPQVVLVHVDAGTQNLGGAVNNAMRGRVPVLIFAGMAPYTQEGELPGGRNEFIHWIQDVRDQRGILRNYVKYDNEIRTGRNVKQLVQRALQISRSEPAGPVYLIAPREGMEELRERAARRLPAPRALAQALLAPGAAALQRLVLLLAAADGGNDDRAIQASVLGDVAAGGLEDAVQQEHPLDLVVEHLLAAGRGVVVVCWAAGRSVSTTGAAAERQHRREK